MSRKTRTPSQPPRPTPKKPQGNRAQKPDAPADSPISSNNIKRVRRNIARTWKTEGVDTEIEVLRSRLRRFMYGKRVHNRDTHISKTLDLLVRALNVKARLAKVSPDADPEGIERILRDASDKLGLKRIPWDSNC